MSRIRKCTTATGVVAGAAAGLFAIALASSATASADTAAPVIPGLGGVIERVLNAPGTIPQQLLQTTSALTGAATPQPSYPSYPASGLGANGYLPQMPMTAQPAAPASTSPLTGNLSSVLPFPIPNLVGTPAPAPTPAATLPGALFPAAPTVQTVPSAPVVTVPLMSGLP
ncbi:MAG TPA: hypothetical protein VF299_11035 [Mycobacterium sp.]